MKNRQLLGTLSTITGAALWGLNSVAGKYVMDTKGVSPIWMVTLRLITAGLIFLLFALFKTRTNNDEPGFFAIFQEKRSLLRLLVIAIFAFAICQATYFATISYANAGISTAIQQTSPAFVLLWVLFSEKRLPKKVEITVLLLVICGAFLLATGGNLGQLVIPLSALVCGLISAVTCAMYTLLPGKLIDRFGTFPTVGWGMLIGGIALIPVSKLWIISGTWDYKTILVFSFVVLFGTVGAFGTYLFGVTIIGPIRGSIYGLLEPVVATLASAVIMGQHFSLTDLIGIAAILAGVAIRSLSKDN